jgi:PKHD-type hydroxylase
MKGEWCYFRSHLSKELCEEIIKTGLTLPVKDGSLGVDGKTDNNSHRKSKIRFIHKTDNRFTWLFDRLWKAAISANDDFFGVHISRLDYLQLAEYDSSYQGEYKVHHDVFWLNGDPVYHRKLSCVVQLSDPSTYDGGNLEIVEAATPLDPAARDQGSVIFFPSMFHHQATKVTKGVRYSLAAWFDGPKWR